MEKYLHELLSISTTGLNRQTYSGKIENEKVFYQLALHNGLIGLIYHAIQKDLVSSALHERLTKDYYTYLSSDIKYHQAIKKINQLLNDNRIDHIFLKGTILKDLYPESYMRVMGDIDILIHDKDFKRVQNVFKENDILLSQKSNANDLYIMHQEITVEIHRNIYKESKTQMGVNLTNPWDFAQQKALFEFRLQPEFEVLYLLYHLAKHIQSSGIGMRSVLDISIYIKSLESEIDATVLNEMLNHTGLNTLLTHVLYINEIFFGIHVDNKFMTEKQHHLERYHEIIDYLIHSGLKDQELANFDEMHMNSTVKSKSFVLLILHFLFPTYKEMASNYHILKKWKIILPILWIYRWFHLVFIGFIRFIKFILKIKHTTKHTEKDMKIWQDLGLFGGL